MIIRKVRDGGIRALSVLTISLVILAPDSTHAQQPDVSILYHEPLTLRELETNPDGSTTRLVFDAFGRRFDLRVEESAPGISGPNIELLKARVADAPESWARLTLRSGVASGLIQDQYDTYVIEPRDTLAGTLMLQNGGGDSAAIIYRLSDTLVAPGLLSCDEQHDGQHVDGKTALAGLTAELGDSTLMETTDEDRATIGVIADSSLYAKLRDKTEGSIEELFLTVGGIYAEQVGIELETVSIDISTEPTQDPVSSQRNASALLDELANWRLQNQSHLSITHLVTNRDVLNDSGKSIAGISFMGAPGRSGVCDARTGTSLSEWLGSGLTALVIAHELGHNFGAPHDGEEGECLDVPPGFLMAPALSPSADQFSDCSIGVITENLASMDCLTPIPTVDLAVEGRRGSDTPYTDTPFDYFVEVTNQGLEPATDVTVQLELDAALEVLAVAPQAGTCTVTQHSVTCDPGEVPGTVTRTIRVNLQSNDPGERTITASLSATADVNAANDSFSDTIAVTSASDLALVTNPQILLLDEREVLSVSLENRSDTATGAITLTGSFSGGLRIDNADFSGTACTIAAEQRTLTCAFAGLAAFSSAAIDFELTGTQSGSQLLSLSVSAQQADPDTANNSASIALEVVTEATDPPEASGGGGSLGPLVVFALLGAWARRRRNTAKQKANFS